MRKLLIALSILVLGGCAAPLGQFDASEVSALRSVTYQIIIGNASCSAVKVDTNLLLTAGHCGDLNDKVQVLDDGKAVTTGIIVKDDDHRDLALVKVEDKLRGRTAVLATDVGYRPILDERAYVAGYPLGLIEVVTEGFWEGYKTFTDEITAETSTIQVATAPIIFGNSGGGLFIKRGDYFYLIGIASALPTVGFGSPVTHLGLFVTQDDIKAFLNDTSR